MASVRRQLRELESKRDDGLRDLGTIALEMHRRKRFQLDVLGAHARELAGVDDEIRELDPARGNPRS